MGTTAVTVSHGYAFDLLLRVAGGRAAGGPIHASLTLTYRVPGIDEPGAVYPAGVAIAPPLGTLSEPPGLGIVLFDVATGRMVTSTEPAAAVTGDEQPMTLLLPNAPYRILIDLTELLPSGLEPGEYGVAVALEAEGIQAISAMQPLTLTAAVPDTPLPRPSPGQSWRHWSMFAPTAAGDAAPIASDDPARWDRVIRRLLRGPDSLETIELQILNVLDGLYLPEAEAIFVELLAARGEPVENAIAALRAREPGLNWWMDRVLDRTGPITILRAIVSPRS